MFISVRIVVVIIELFLEWFRLSVTSFCLFSHTLSFISSTLAVTGKQILLLLLLLLLLHDSPIICLYKIRDALNTSTIELTSDFLRLVV